MQQSHLVWILYNIHDIQFIAHQASIVTKTCKNRLQLMQRELQIPNNIETYKHQKHTYIRQLHSVIPV